MRDGTCEKCEAEVVRFVGFIGGLRVFLVECTECEYVKFEER